ncbi:leucine-rich repeat domain-containing protein, partial [Butyricicoccus sp.]|uniref:leucine-rich repeat domain-containing protein n=1 Tax=Butyricicoccus sp. TaxID=2049021 RepID=UPI003F14138E
LVLSVAAGSYAEDYAKANGIAYEARAVDNTPVYSGTCGDNVNWELYADGALKLTGSGAMASYSSGYQNVPWYNYRTAIKSIEIGKDITNISVYAFRGASNCTSVAFEEGSKVTSIGGNAFYYMSSLKEITLPENVTSIGNYAFGYDKNLTKVYVPDMVSSINATAFSNCDTSKLVLSVAAGSYAEDYAKANDIAYETREAAAPVTLTAEQASGICGDTMTWTVSDNGILSIAGSGYMYSYRETAAPWSGYSDSITAIEIGKDVSNIGMYAFSGMKHVKTVTFAEGSVFKTVMDYAFSGCEALESMVLPEGTQVIGEAAYSGCTALTAITIPSSVTSMGTRVIDENQENLISVFDGCNAEKLIVTAEKDSAAEAYAQAAGLTVQNP